MSTSSAMAGSSRRDRRAKSWAGRAIPIRVSFWPRRRPCNHAGRVWLTRAVVCRRVRRTATTWCWKRDALTKQFSSIDGRAAFAALADVSFTLRRGEVLGVIGESGSEKSTCARIVLGLVRPDAGDVRFLGRQWSCVAESVRRDLRRAMQYIPQDPLSSFDPRTTVEEIIGENLADPPGGKPARQARTAELLGEVGLGAAFLRHHPRSLSGGQRQRVAIARALASRPELIVCDEPVAALNVSVQAQVLDLVGALQRRFGVALLFISHDLGVIEHMSDRVLVLHQGRPVEQGEPEALFAAPQHDSTRRLTAAHSALLTTTA